MSTRSGIYHRFGRVTVGWTTVFRCRHPPERLRCSYQEARIIQQVRTWTDRTTVLGRGRGGHETPRIA